MPERHVSRQHRRTLASASGAVDRVEETLARRPDETALGVLRACLAAVTADDITLLARVSGPEWKAGVASLTKMRLDPRYVKNGYGQLVVGPLRRLWSSCPLEVAELLLLPAFNNRAARTLGDRFDNPDDAAIAELVEVLLGEFPARLVGCYLATVAATDAPAARVASQVLADDARLAG